MSNIEVEISAHEPSPSDATQSFDKLTLPHADSLPGVTQQSFLSSSESEDKVGRYSNEEEEVHFEKDGHNAQNASLVEPPLEGSSSTSTVSSESSSSTPEEVEGVLSQEERLVERVAEFEGKVEALRSLKESLYSAIEQLELQQ